MTAALVVIGACGPTAPAIRSVDPSADVVLAYKVNGGGEVRFTVRPRYAAAAPIAIQLDITAGSQQILGPISGQVLESALSGGEQTVRRFANGEVAIAEVAPGQRQHITVTWDGKDATGAFVRPETYSFSLDFIIGSDRQRLGTVIEVRD